jgi:2-iminobutanoate/2-iminopropanoate deaminase
VLGVDVLEGLVDPLDESSDSMHVVAVRRVAAVVAIVDPAEAVRSYESIKAASVERTPEPGAELLDELQNPPNGGFLMSTDRDSTTKQVIRTNDAVLPVGPFSQAVRAGDFLFISGTVPYDSETEKVIEGGVEAQTAHVMGSIRAILEAAGGTLNDLVKVTIHMKDVDDWHKMNDVYRSSSTTTCRRA